MLQCKAKMCFLTLFSSKITRAKVSMYLILWCNLGRGVSNMGMKICWFLMGYGGERKYKCPHGDPALYTSIKAS